MALETFILVVVGGLAFFGALSITFFVWAIWRGDKEDHELPLQYAKLERWIKKAWEANMDRAEKRKLERSLR